MDMEAPVAKRVNRGPLQSTSASDLDASAAGSALSLHSEDVAHLQGLDPTFARTTNLILTAKNNDVTIGFPVHKDIISAHSSILCQFIGELRPSDSKAPQLPMVDDSCAALRQVLASIDGSFGHMEEPPASPSAFMFRSFLWPRTADRLRLCHKYGMLKIRAAQEKSLMPSLMEFVEGSFCSEQYHMMPVIACAAEECGCKDMLILCEAFMVRFFHVYALQGSGSPQKMIKLPPSSMIRISIGLLKSHRDTMSAVYKVLDASVNEAKKCSLNSRPGSTCPRCDEALNNVVARRLPDGTILQNIPQHKDSLNRCNWPREHNFTESNPKIADVAKYVALLHTNN